MTPHKWAKEIKAWADGAEIQYRIKPRVEGGEYSAWVTQKNPQWYTSDVAEYRIKPGQDVKDPSVEAFEKREVAHWKANHANRVEAARVLIERPDMPLERVDAYRKYLRALQVAQDIIEQGKGRPLPGMEVIERLIGDPKREALLAEAVDLLKWMNDNGRLLCDGSIRWRAQEVIRTYEG